MPTYQYHCTECGRDLEVQQSFSDASLTECPTCQGRLRKVFNAVGVVFKGSGFYRNDSRSSDSGSKDGSSDAKSDTKADTKADAKADTTSGATTEKKSETAKPAGKDGSSSSGSKASTSA